MRPNIGRALGKFAAIHPEDSWLATQFRAYGPSLRVIHKYGRWEFDSIDAHQ